MCSSDLLTKNPKCVKGSLTGWDGQRTRFGVHPTTARPPSTVAEPDPKPTWFRYQRKVKSCVGTSPELRPRTRDHGSSCVSLTVLGRGWSLGPRQRQVVSWQTLLTSQTSQNLTDLTCLGVGCGRFWVPSFGSQVAHRGLIQPHMSGHGHPGGFKEQGTTVQVSSAGT